MTATEKYTCSNYNSNYFVNSVVVDHYQIENTNIFREMARTAE